MAHRIAHCIALVATLLLLACGGADTQQALLLDEIAIQMNTAPDSALARLDSMDAETLPRHQRMRWELLRGNCLNKTDVPFTTDSLMLRVADYFDHHGTPNQRLLAHYVLGCTYRDMGDAPRALECYQTAIHNADTTAQDCDFATLMRVHSQKSLLYHLQQLYEEEKENIWQAIHYAERIEDTLSVLALKENLCNTLFLNEEYDECVRVTKEISKAYKLVGRPTDAIYANLNLIKVSLLKRDFLQAKICIDQYDAAIQEDAVYGNADNGNNPFYTNKANYYLETHQPDSAVYYYKKAHASNPWQNAMVIYHGLMDAFTELGQSDSVLAYSRSNYLATEEYFNAQMAEASMRVKSLYDYTVEQARTQQETLRAKRLHYGIIITVLLLVATIILSLYLLEKRKRKIEQQQHEYQSIQNKLASVQAQLAVLSSEKATIEDMLSEVQVQKSKELAIQKAHLEEDMAILIHEMETYRQKAEQMERILDKKAICEKEKTSEQTDIISTLHANIGKPIHESQWKQLREVIESTYPTFYEKTNSREKLSTNEYRICLLVKAGFEPSVINLFMCKSESFASQARKRLLRKIFGIKGNGADLDQKLREIT